MTILALRLLSYSVGVFLMRVAASCTEFDAAAWPQFRGPGGTGISDTATAPIRFGPANAMAWKTALPSGHSSPTLWGDHIFISAFNKASSELEVLSLARGSGKILWRRAVPAGRIENVHEVSSPATATPALDQQNIYAYFASYGLICFDHNGNQRWAVPLPLVNVPYGSGTSPVLAGAFVIISRDEGTEPYLLAIDRSTGRTAWKQPQYVGPPEGRTFNASTPVIWKEEIVLHHRNEIVGFDLVNGRRKWWVRAMSQGTGTPVAALDTIYAATWFNTGEPDLRVSLEDFESIREKYDRDSDGVISRREFPEKILRTRRVEVVGVQGADQFWVGKELFQVIDQNQDGHVDRMEWTAHLAKSPTINQEHGLLAIKPGGQGDVTFSRVIWREHRAVPEVPTPLFYNGRVYTVTNGGIVSCIDAGTGALLFRGRLGAGGPYFASPIAASGHVYFTSGAGVISVIRDGDRLEILANNVLPEPIFATPAIAGGFLYVRTTSALYAFK